VFRLLSEHLRISTTPYAPPRSRSSRSPLLTLSGVVNFASVSFIDLLLSSLWGQCERFRDDRLRQSRRTIGDMLRTAARPLTEKLEITH
jgi:hypothetical protein